jgi:hypothetical protein
VACYPGLGTTAQGWSSNWPECEVLAEYADYIAMAVVLLLFVPAVYVMYRLLWRRDP